MHILLGGVHVVLLLFLLLLLFRWAMDLVLLISPSYRPTGAIASVLEVTYSVTDPPLRFLRRFIPPVRIGVP
jgi:YggT family protein